MNKVQYKTAPVLIDEEANEIPTQLLDDGSLVFIAGDVPAKGRKVFSLQSSVVSEGGDDRNGESFDSDKFTIKIDEKTGAIKSLVYLPEGWEMADTKNLKGLNEYFYVEGRKPDNPLPAVLKDVKVLEDGPVMKVVRLEVEAPGCNSYYADIQLIDDLSMIRIINYIDKQKVLSPEAVHIAFPFNLPNGQIHYDLAYGYCRPEIDQAPGANKNFLCMEHWLDVSNDTAGVTLICPDAPLFEVDRLTMDEIVTGWVDHIPPSQTVFSYLMNNYWETNYAASQEGLGEYRYVIIPHGKFDPERAEEEAVSQRQPLIGRFR
jgi:alpha-mannosidase